MRPYDDSDLIRKAQGNAPALELLRAFSLATGPGEFAAFYERVPDGAALAASFEAYCARHPLPERGPRHDQRMGFLLDVVHEALPGYALPATCELPRADREARREVAFRQAIGRMTPLAIVRAHRGEEPELERLRQFSCRACPRLSCANHLGPAHPSTASPDAHAPGGW